MSKYKMIKCEICNKYFERLHIHISRTHNISSKDYYDRYYRNYRRDEGFCPICGNNTNFWGLRQGYAKTCSYICSNTWTPFKNNKLAQIDNKPLFIFWEPKIGWIEEVRIDPNDNRFLNVTCKNCGDWFIPRLLDLKNRIQALKGNSGDGSYLYCSPDCKQECILYNYHPKKSDNPSYNEPENSRDGYWTKLVKERDNYTCVKCGETENIVAHHIDPVKTHPFFANDIDNGITLCVIHDKEAHQIDGCKTGQLARMVC